MMYEKSTLTGTISLSDHQLSVLIDTFTSMEQTKIRDQVLLALVELEQYRSNVKVRIGANDK